MAKEKINWMEKLLKDEKTVLAADVKPRVKVPLNSPSLNWAFSGGFYKGYTTCLYGKEQGGKSLMSMMGVAALHKSNPNALAVLISTEMRDPTPAKLITLGVDPDRLLIRKVNTLSDVFDWYTSSDAEFKNTDGSKGGPGLHYCLKEGAPIEAVIIDSIKAIRGPKEQSTESVEDNFMGDLSFYLNPSFRKILPVIREFDIMSLFVQQVSMNMDSNTSKYQPWTIPSGQALKHFCETMALVERVTAKDSKLYSIEKASVRDLPVQEGHTVRVKVEKANLDSPFREAEFRINYNKGIVDIGLEVALMAKGMNILKHPLNKDGKPIASQYQFGEKLWVGFDNMVAEFEADAKLRETILKEVQKVS